MIYKFPTYVPVIAVAIAVVAAIVGVILIWARRPLRFIIGSFVLAVLAGAIFAPALALDRVVLDDEKLEQTTGFWFSPTVKGFRLADTAVVTIGTELDRKGRTQEVWIITAKDGSTRTIDPGDLWEMNGADIIKRLREKGIEVRQ